LWFFFDGVPSSEQLREDKNCFVSSNKDQENTLYYNPLHYESKKDVSRLNRENASQPTKISKRKSCIHSLDINAFNKLFIEPASNQLACNFESSTVLSNCMVI